MLDVKIKINFSQWEREFTKFVKKQIPYAAARTLTQIAKEAQFQLKEELQDQFTIRNDWTQKGIQIIPAKKQDWPMIQSTVYCKDVYMQRQEESGIKTGIGGKEVAEPYLIRAKKTDMTKPSRWPSRLLKKKGFFKVKLKEKPLSLVLYRKPTQGRGEKYQPAAQKAELMYILAPSVEVKKRWNFRETVAKVVNESKFKKLFGKFLGEAIRSAK